MDELIVQAEYTHDVDVAQIPELKAKLEGELRNLGLRTIVEMMESGSLERTQFKARRAIDKRDLYDEIVKKG